MSNLNEPDYSLLSKEAHPRGNGLRMIIFGILFLLLFGGLFVFGLLPKLSNRKHLVQDARPQLTMVTITTPARQDKSSTLTLPGDVEPYQQTAVFSRVDGYLKDRTVDIGDHVAANQVLAVVETPTTDQDLKAAQANLLLAQANAAAVKTRLDLALVTLKRWQANAQAGAVSQQDVDQRKADYTSSQAAYQAAIAQVNANKAAINRVQSLEAYKQVRAPFSGVISQRNVDKGANIVAGGSATSTSLFTLVQPNPLRVYVNVPQANTPSIHIGMKGTLQLPGQSPASPNAQIVGHVDRTAGAIDPKSRTLITEVLVPNPTGKLYSGTYAQVQLNLGSKGHPLLVADNAVVILKHGLGVVTVSKQKPYTLHYIPIQQGRDFGDAMEVLSGLSGNEWLVQNPTDALREGQHVNVQQDNSSVSGQSSSSASSQKGPGSVRSPY